MLALNENNTVKIPRRGYNIVKSLFGQHEEIPEDWDLKKLEEIGKIVGGGTPDSTIMEYWNGKILWAIPTDITKLQTNQIENTERKITKEGLDNSSAKLLPKGTILITSRATIGECAIATKPISTNQGFQSIICDDKNFNRTYIFYSIKCHKNELLRLAYGTTFLEINKTEIKKVMLPAPSSILEQQKIASILSGVDALIESTQKTVEKTERLKKGLMQKLLTRGIGHTKFKKVKSFFGKYKIIPEDWDLKKLEEIGKIVGGGTPDSTILEYWNGKILWAIPTDITKLQTNQIENTERKITKEGLDNSSAKLLPKGTILITSRATIGECAIATKPISTNQGFQSIICNDKNFNRTYIFYSIKYHKNELLRLAYGTTFLEINKTEIKKVILPTPSSILEQQKIASILSGVDAIKHHNIIALITLRIKLAIFLTLFVWILGSWIQQYRKKPTPLS